MGFAETTHFLCTNKLLILYIANAVFYLIVPYGKNARMLPLTAISTSLFSKAMPFAQLPNRNRLTP